MKIFKVKFNFNDEMIIGAEDKDKALEQFCFSYKDECISNNETAENRMWESITVEEVKK